MKFKNKAFTLAETLVVMGIIGVIAALTIPNLSQSTGNQERIAKVKKAYSEVNEALDRATAIYGPLDSWAWDSSDDNRTNMFGDRVCEFMKTSKVCRVGTDCSEFSDYTNNALGRYAIILSDGTRLVFGVWGSDGSGDHTVYTNKAGKCKKAVDNHGFIVRKDTDYRFEPRYLRSDFNTILNEANYCRFGTGADNTGYCRGSGASWILLYDNADYLKLDKDKKCPNGTTPTESNPRCN